MTTYESATESPSLDRALIPGMRAPLTPGQVGRILKARRVLIASVVGIFVLFALLAVLLLTNKYAAKVSLLIEFPGDDPVTGQQYPSNLADSYQATQVGLLTSFKVLLGVVDELNLTDNAEARETFESDAPDGAMFDEWLAQRMGEDLSIQADQTSRLLVVEYADKDAQQSAAIANAVVRQYMSTSSQLNADPARSRQARYSTFLEGLRSEVDTAQTRLTQVQQRLQVISTDNAGNIETQRLEDLGLKLNQAESDN